MVGALEQEQENYRSRSSHFKGMHENSNVAGGAAHVKSWSVDCAADFDQDHESRGLAGSKSNDQQPKNGSVSSKNVRGPNNSKLPKDESEATAAQAIESPFQDIDQMKERFAKLLLGEDMSGGGKGVGSALALSNAITNLAASVFGEQTRLVPMAPETKAKWRREVDWLLSVTDQIVELVPSQQKNKDGSNMEIMVTKQRADLHMNIPALRKLDAMLIGILDHFKDQNEFSYASKDASESEKGTKRKDEKWWLPTVKIPPNGLSEESRKFLQYQKDCVNQVLKAAMAINAQVLAEMPIPEDYIESLPKNGRSTLGDAIYKGITVDFFDPDLLLSTIDLSSDHKILDLKNKIEASIVIWKRKMNQKDGKSAWGSAVSLEKRELFEDRAETILLMLKQHFPGLPQSSLDISKIQFNKDIGHAILEGYSRVLESLASTVLSRIEDVLYADFVTRNPSKKGEKRNSLRVPSLSLAREESETKPVDRTLFDFMGWNSKQNESDNLKNDPFANSDELLRDDANKLIPKVPNEVTEKKAASYLENLGQGGVKSPTSRR